ncbi:hypothetical protein ACFL12_00835 [Pseudomonadota bacterium]
MTSINELLAKRDANLFGDPGNEERARKRLNISTMIGNDFEAFNHIRAHLLSKKPFKNNIPGKTKIMLGALTNAGYLKRLNAQEYHPASDDAFQYLKGDWLEELAFFAMKEAGTDECYFRQNISWRVGDVEDHQEIDVIARRGDVLSFTSCKTADSTKPMGKVTQKYRTFLLEAEYWDRHFTDGKGKVILLVTRDLIDEANNHTPRHPTLFARAEVLDVDLIGLDFFKWSNLVQKFREHWN